MNRRIVTHMIGVQMGALVICLCHVISGGRSVRGAESFDEPPVGFSAEAITGKLVAIHCENKKGNRSHSGFLAVMEGETYLLTRQSFLLGAERISFRTLGGIILQPKAIELAETRDVARLLIDAKVPALQLFGETGINDPVCIPQVGKDDEDERALQGRIIGVGPDIIEVSTDFVLGNSGSPLLTTNCQVVGIASYVRFFYKDKGGDRTRRYCYRVAGEGFKPVNWRTFNKQHGKTYIQSVAFVLAVEELCAVWEAAPYNRLAEKNLQDDRLRNWAKKHNEIIDLIEAFRHKGPVTPRDLKVTNAEIQEELKRRARVFALLCKALARDMRRLAGQKEIPDYLKNQYEMLGTTLEGKAEAILDVGEYLANRDFFYFR